MSTKATDELHTQKGQGKTRKDKFIKGIEKKGKGMIKEKRVKSNQLAEKLCLGLGQMVTPGSHKCHA